MMITDDVERLKCKGVLRMENTRLENLFFAILNTSLTYMFIYCS